MLHIPNSSHRLRNHCSCINGKFTQGGYKVLCSGHIFEMVVRKVQLSRRGYLKIISHGNYSFNDKLMNNIRSEIKDSCKFCKVCFLSWLVLGHHDVTFFIILYSVDSKAICYSRFASWKSLGFGRAQPQCLWKCWDGVFLPWGFPVYDQINSRWVLMLLEKKQKAKRGTAWFWGANWFSYGEHHYLLQPEVS